jgi:tetratricopeptide (TPR) repeat protein
MRRRYRALLLGLVATCAPSLVAQDQLGKIVGQIRVDRGDFPPHQIMVELQVRFSTINSVYADSQGRFGFYGLEANPYHVLIRDEAFRPVDELAIVNPTVSPTTMVQVILEPRQETKQNAAQDRVGGSNPYLINSSEYKRNFPKSAVKEFEKGLDADGSGKTDDAARHYEKALRIAPDFYPAHNNLGSHYLNKGDSAAARKEFEEVIRLNQSDAAAYFNLTNVCLLLGQVNDAKRYLDEGMRRQPDSAFGQFLLGTLNIRESKLPQAEGALRRAIQLDPVMAQARLQLVNLLVQQGRKADAAEQLKEFVQAFPDNSLTPQARQLLQRLQSPANTSIPN